MRKTSVVRSLAVALAVLTFGACKKKPTELAPVQPGDWFEYKFTITSGMNQTSSYMAKIKIMEQDADSYRVEGDPPANQEPTIVDKALDSGHAIKNHSIGVIWLPPAARVAGATTRVGSVKEQKSWMPYPSVWCVYEAGNKPGRYYYDPDSGFLVGYEIGTSEGIRSARLTQTSIAGLLK
jgi:hypothetical protein